jgi:hypothetical protein
MIPACPEMDFQFIQVLARPICAFHLEITARISSTQFVQARDSSPEETKPGLESVAKVITPESVRYFSYPTRKNAPAVLWDQLKSRRLTASPGCFDL